MRAYVSLVHVSGWGLRGTGAVKRETKHRRWSGTGWQLLCGDTSEALKETHAKLNVTVILVYFLFSQKQKDRNDKEKE